MSILLISLTISLSQVVSSDYPPPRELYTLSWTGGPFVWPSAVVRNMYKSTGKFISKNMIATRAVVFREDVYVIFPRYLPGVAATLVRTPLLCPNGEPTFEPFPSWEAQTEGDCDCLQNAVDLFLDGDNILWVLDTGVTQTLDKPVRQCGPKAVGFDLVTGKRVYKVDLTDLSTKTSRLQYIVADFDNRNRRFLYISDAAEHAILVYNLAEDTGYKVVLPESVVADCPRGIPDVLYLVLAKPMADNLSHRLYFTYLSGADIYSIQTKDLQRGSDNGIIEVVNGAKPHKMVIIGTDSKGTVFFRNEGQGNVFSWDVNNDLAPENCHLVYSSDSFLLATQAVLDPIRGKIRILLSNFLDFLQQSVGVGAVHVLRAIN